MSRTMLGFCIALACGTAASVHAANEGRLERAQGAVTGAAEAQPQSPGLPTARGVVTDNRERLERGTPPERAERPERPERPERVTTSDIVRSNGATAPRPDRPGLGKGR